MGGTCRLEQNLRAATRLRHDDAVYAEKRTGGQFRSVPNINKQTKIETTTSLKKY